MSRTTVFWSAVRNWGQRLGAVLTFFILVRILTQQEIAVFAAAAAVIALLDLFTDNGLGDAVVQAKEVPPSVATAVLILNVGIGFVLWASVQIFAQPIATLLGVQGGDTVLRVAAIVLLLNSIGFVPQALLRKEFEFKRLAMRSLAATILAAITGIAMALAGFGVWSMIAQFVVLGAVNAAMAWYPPVLIPERPNFSAIKPFIKFGSRVFATRILYYTSFRVMEIILPILFGPTALALYFMSVRLPAVLSQLLVSVATDIGLPRFSKLADNPVALADAFFGSLVVSAGVSIPAFFILGALAPEIAAVAFGENGRGTEQLLLPLAIVSAFQSVGAYNQIILNSRGMSGISFWLSLGNATIGMMVFFFAKDTDLFTFILAYAASQCVLIPLDSYIGGRFSGVSFGRLAKVTYSYFVSAGLGLAVVWALRPYLVTTIASELRHSIMKDIIVGGLLGVVFVFIYLVTLMLLDRQAVATIGRQFLLRRKSAPNSET